MKYTVKNTLTAYRKDMRFRAEAMLSVSLIINGAYAVFEALYAYIQHSPRCGTLAFYYIILSLMRFIIFKGNRKESLRHKWKSYRTCAAIMLVLTVFLAAIHYLYTYKGDSIIYRGYAIYAVATYTFYSITAAIRNMVIYRRLNDPVISASKALNLTVAAISLYSLQSAMITAFGKNNSETFRIVMGNCVSAGVFAVIVFISVMMIYKANKELKRETA